MGNDQEMIDVDDGDEASIDEEQLEEYKDEVEQLGDFPDKVTINSLSMVAEDHAESEVSARAIYNVIRQRLLNTTRENMLPLVYVLDSILKNAKGKYIEIAEKDFVEWMPVVHQKLQKEQQAKLKRVWKTWEEFKLFDPDDWKAMGRCFSTTEKTAGLAAPSSTVAGIARTNDGKLILPGRLRTEMQNILDELQSDVNNELEKVSLERLADINPDLLSQIKKTAEDNMRTVPSAQTGARDEDQEQLPSFFTETRPPKVLERSKEWRELENWDYLKKSHDVITNLQHAVRKGAESNGRYTQQEALDMTHYFATASATASLLTEALERIKNQQDRTNHKKRVSFPGTGSSGVTVTAAIGLDPKDFTNDGIKKKNETVISLLYEIGLPFLHSKTGRRFRKQEELAAYMDVVFKKTQLEKSMARTEERGWYVADAVWAGEGGEEDLLPTADTAEAAQTSAAEDEFAPDRSTVPADESRDRCVICGINFKMSFDNEAGLYMYSNCREIVVLNDDAAEKESEDELVHVTCWKGLGGPEVLTSDQTLQETLRY